MATTKIKCPLEGVIELDRLPGVSPQQVQAIIDTHEFQRLRWISQLGMTQLVFPGGNHSRFEHSLGAFQGVQRALAEFRSRGEHIPDEWYVATAFGALLHDIGHGPFSHSFEGVTGLDHEEFTLRIVSEDTDVNKALGSIDKDLPTRVAQVIDKKIPNEEWRWLGTLVSGQLDCDRIDYLRRDALHTGADYGRFDRDWLFRGLRPADDRSSLVVGGLKGLAAVEQYLIGRYHMYRAVYFHKTTRGFERLFRSLCVHLAGNPAIAVPENEFSTYLWSDAEARKKLGTYCALTDVSFLSLLPRLSQSADATTAFLAKSLHGRRPLRCIENPGRYLAQERESGEQRARGLGLRHDCVVFVDEPRDFPFKPYEHIDEKKSIRVVAPDGGQARDVTHFSPTIATLSQSYYLQRVYCPA